MNEGKNLIRHTLLPIITAFLWGTAFIAQDIAAEHAGPFTVNTARTLLSAVVLTLGISLFNLITKKKVSDQRSEEQKKEDRKSLILGSIMCGTALTVAQALQQYGIAGSEPGKAGFITTLYIVIVPLLGIFLKKKVSFKIWISVITAVVGFYFLCIKEGFQIDSSDLFLLYGAIIFSIHILIIDHFTQTVNGLYLSCGQLIVASIISAILMFAFEEPSISQITVCIGPIVYLGIVSNGIAYTLQIIAQKGANPMVFSLLLSLESVFALLTDIVINKTVPTPKEALGCLLIFSAVILTQLPEFKKKKRVQK